MVLISHRSERICNESEYKFLMDGKEDTIYIGNGLLKYKKKNCHCPTCLDLKKRKYNNNNNSN